MAITLNIGEVLRLCDPNDMEPATSAARIPAVTATGHFSLIFLWSLLVKEVFPVDRYSPEPKLDGWQQPVGLDSLRNGWTTDDDSDLAFRGINDRKITGQCIKSSQDKRVKTQKSTCLSKLLEKTFEIVGVHHSYFASKKCVWHQRLPVFFWRVLLDICYGSFRAVFTQIQPIDLKQYRPGEDKGHAVGEIRRYQSNLPIYNMRQILPPRKLALQITTHGFTSVCFLRE